MNLRVESPPECAVTIVPITGQPKTGIRREKPRLGRQVHVLRFDQLTEHHLKSWQAIRSLRAEFNTPFFSTQFSAAVHRARGDVEVAIVSEDNQIIGFLPFQRVNNVAHPVGRCFNDAHNLIAEKDAGIDWIWLLEQIDVKAYDFHAMLGSSPQRLGPKNHIGTIASFCATLGDDSQAFLAKISKRHKTIRRQPQKTRKMAREIGPVQLEIDCRSTDLLDQTIRWKRDQYNRTNILDFFTPKWTRDLLSGLFNPECLGELPGNARGLLSVLRAGENVVAAHYGIIEDDLLHYWFPTYDPKYARYSPGTALFRQIVAAASDHGIRYIDMGYGEQPYKLKQTDTKSEITYGCISRSSMYRRWRNLETAAVGMIKQAPMKESLKRVWRRIQPQAGISKLR